MQTNEKLAALRARMHERGIDAYLVFSEDAHYSEYVATHWRCREWISGFDGSAGALAVTRDEALLWTDGRYYIQAAKQIAGSEFKLRKTMEDMQEWLLSELPRNSVVGFDGRTLSVSAFEKYDRELSFKTSEDIVGELWVDRPELPAAAIFEHGVEFAGKRREEKLEQARGEMKKKSAEAYLISSLDDIAWLFNLRGGDIPHVPVFYAYAVIDTSDAYLFVDEAKLDEELRSKLERERIILRPYESAAEFLKGLTVKSILIDPDRISVYLNACIPEGTRIIRSQELTSALKAVKNGTEISNIRRTQLKDGAAMVKFIKWIKEAVKSVELEEADIHEKLLELRGEQAEFMGASFGTIAAYMDNAASMHYTPVKGRSARLKPEGILLVDSGGQYLGGTTDITRTIVLGDINDELRLDFTTVLKAHIALAETKFLYGAWGSYLDSIPRRVLWERGLDYKCGTGHGIGYFLNVHEGPQRMRMGQESVRLEPGMLLTNEPGIYKENRWGIRTENTMLVEDDRQTEDGRFMKFGTISYCPIDLDGIDAAELTSRERIWLNNYHAEVYAKLSPFLDIEHREWLKANTREI